MNLLLHDFAAAITRDASLDLPRPWSVAQDTLAGADQVEPDEVASVLTTPRTGNPGRSGRVPAASS